MKQPVLNRSILGVAIGVLLTGPAYATDVNLSGDNEEDTIEDILNEITQPTTSNPSGQSSIDASADQLSQDEIWAVTASGSANFTLITELAGYAPLNSFGIYDAADTNRMVVLFDGAASSGDAATLTLFDYDQNGQDYNVYVNGTDTGVSFVDNRFGFFLDTPDGIWYSVPSLNWAGTDHLVAYQGNDSDVLRLPYRPDGLWTDNEFILAWEDAWTADYDFNDFVTMVESVIPVTEPSTLALFGISLLGIAGIAKRRKQ